MAYPPPQCFLVLLLFAAAATLSACEEDVVAILGIGYPFEVYGVLNPAADTQRVRVFPMVDRLRRLEEPTVDADVTTTDFETGIVRSWEDSVLTFSDGTHGYLFWSDFRAEGGRSYRIEVARSDGETSSATVAVPNVPRIEIGDPLIGADVSLPVALTEGARHVDSLSVEYRVEYDWCPGSFQTYTFDYLNRMRPQGESGYFEIATGEDFRRIFQDLALKELFDLDFGVVLVGVKLYMQSGVMWEAPGGMFDPEVLIEPGVMSNVENGFGFVGSGYERDAEVRLYGMPEIFGPPDPHHIPAEAMSASGFTLAIPPGGCDPTSDDG